MIVLFALALASEGAMVVMPATGGPNPAAVTRTLKRAGFYQKASVDASEFAAGVLHVRLPSTRGDDCLEAVHLVPWRERLDAARRRYDLFDAEGSLSDLVVLDLELECLVDPVPASTIVLLDVSRAEAHLLLEAGSAHDLGQAAFHVAEAGRALDRVVATGSELVPTEASPELVAGLQAAETRRRDLGGPRVATTALPSGEALRVNGRLVGADGSEAAVGDNLVQRIDSTGTVVGSSRLSLRDGEDAVFSGGSVQSAFGDLLDSLVRRAPTRDEESVLAVLAAARGWPNVVVYAGWTNGGPTLWWVTGERLVRLEVPRAEREAQREAERQLDEEVQLFSFGPPADRVAVAPSPAKPSRPERPVGVASEPVEAWRSTAALRVGGGWREEGEAGALSVGFAGRVAVAADWAIAWGVLPESDVGSLDPSGTGVEARVPVRLGVRWGPHRAGWSAEVGGDVGLVAAVAPDPRPLLGVCGAAAVRVGAAVGLRFEGCVDHDLVGASVGGALSIESRI